MQSYGVSQCTPHVLSAVWEPDGSPCPPNRCGTFLLPTISTARICPMLTRDLHSPIRLPKLTDLPSHTSHLISSIRSDPIRSGGSVRIMPPDHPYLHLHSEDLLSEAPAPAASLAALASSSLASSAARDFLALAAFWSAAFCFSASLASFSWRCASPRSTTK